MHNHGRSSSVELGATYLPSPLTALLSVPSISTTDSPVYRSAGPSRQTDAKGLPVRGLRPAVPSSFAGISFIRRASSDKSRPHPFARVLRAVCCKLLRVDYGTVTIIGAQMVVVPTCSLVPSYK